MRRPLSATPFERVKGRPKRTAALDRTAGQLARTLVTTWQGPWLRQHPGGRGLRLMDGEYEFSVDWFSLYWHNWLAVTEGRRISKILEIGSFEGRSACTMIDHFSRAAPLEVFCIDSWRSGFERGAFDMAAVEQRFDRNVARAIAGAPNPVNLHKYKGVSTQEMVELLHYGHRQSFDLVFVDGSHQAADVLSDLVLGYHLCAVGGLIIADDYLWSGETHGREDLLSMPRPAIDAFAGIFTRELQQLGGVSIYQVYFRKTA
jgi:predicted O-methyltransferase YrrM